VAGLSRVQPLQDITAAQLPLFPTRGDGHRVRQRRWIGSSRRGVFQWIAWRPAIDGWGIDALLDLSLQDVGDVTIAMYQVVPYQPSARADTTRARRAH
jgi:hypothetical protein